MHRKRLLLIVLTIVLFSLSGIAAAQTGQIWSISSDSDTLTIEYPTGWVIDQNQVITLASSEAAQSASLDDDPIPAGEMVFTIIQPSQLTEGGMSPTIDPTEAVETMIGLGEFLGSAEPYSASGISGATAIVRSMDVIYGQIFALGFDGGTVVVLLESGSPPDELAATIDQIVGGITYVTEGSAPIAGDDSGTEPAFLWMVSQPMGDTEVTAFGDLYGVALAPDRSLYALDADNGIWQIDPVDGSVIGQLQPDGLFFADDLDVDPETGNLYVASWSEGSVFVVSTDGDVLNLIGSTGTGDGQFGTFSPQTVVIHDGELYASDGNQDAQGNSYSRVQVFDLDGNFLRAIDTSAITTFEPEFDVAPDGRLYVGGFGTTIGLFAPDGTMLDDEIGSGELFGIAVGGIDVAEDGSIYVASWHDGIMLLSPEGDIVAQYGIGLSSDIPDPYTPSIGEYLSPTGITVSDDGIVYMTDNFNGKASALSALALNGAIVPPTVDQPQVTQVPPTSQPVQTGQVEGVSVTCPDGRSFSNGVELVANVRSGFSYFVGVIGIDGFDPVLAIREGSGPVSCTDTIIDPQTLSVTLPSTGALQADSTSAFAGYFSGGSSFVETSFIVGSFDNQAGEFVVLIDQMGVTPEDGTGDGAGDPISLRITPNVAAPGPRTAYMIGVDESLDPYLYVVDANNESVVLSNGSLFACDDAGGSGLCYGDPAPLVGSTVTMPGREVEANNLDASLSIPDSEVAGASGFITWRFTSFGQSTFGKYIAAFHLATAAGAAAEPPTQSATDIRQWASFATGSSQYGTNSWSFMQATGAPDTADCGDRGTAWASSSSTGTEMLALEFEQTVLPSEINIYQTYNPGSIIRVELTNTDDSVILPVPDSADPPGNTPCPGVFTLDVSRFDVPVNGVILYFDQSIGGSWNEIDAVELVGTPDGGTGETTAPTTGGTGGFVSGTFGNLTLEYPDGWVTDADTRGVRFASHPDALDLGPRDPLPEGQIRIEIATPDMLEALGLTVTGPARDLISTLQGALGSSGPIQEISGLAYSGVQSPLAEGPNVPPGSVLIGLETPDGILLLAVRSETLLDYQEELAHIINSITLS